MVIKINMGSREKTVKLGGGWNCIRAVFTDVSGAPAPGSNSGQFRVNNSTCDFTGPTENVHN
jgi:hypothetical protein